MEINFIERNDPNKGIIEMYLEYKLPRNQLKNLIQKVKFILDYFYQKNGKKIIINYTNEEVLEFYNFLNDQDIHTRTKFSYRNALKELTEMAILDGFTPIFSLNILEKEYFQFRAKKIFDYPDDPNREKLLQFIQERYKKGNSQCSRINYLNDCLIILYNLDTDGEKKADKYQNNTKKYVLEYTPADFRKLWVVINKKDVQKVSKSSMYSYLGEFILDLIVQLEEWGEKPPFDYNYEKIFSLKNRNKKFASGGSTHNLKILTPDLVWELLHKLRKVNFDLYIYCIILLSSCRFIGLSNIKISNIDWENAFFITSGKKTYSSTKNKYYFSKKAIPDLRNYILRHNLDNSDWLFTKHLSTINYFLKMHVPGLTTRAFRHFMITQWYRFKMDYKDQCVLSNHKPEQEKRVHLGYVETKSDEELTKVYNKVFDRIFPVFF